MLLALAVLIGAAVLGLSALVFDALRFTLVAKDDGQPGDGGGEDDPPADLHCIPQLRPGDTLLACSDGLWHYFSPEELGSVIASLSPREASEFLIDKARSRGHGGGDNLSLVIVKLEPLGS